MLEIAVPGGSAARDCGLEIGDAVQSIWLAAP
jgi:hypothetical protein